LLGRVLGKVFVDDPLLLGPAQSLWEVLELLGLVEEVTDGSITMAA